MSTANRIIKNTGYLYAKIGINMFISISVTRLILNSLGASDFGVYNIVGGAISMLGFLNVAMATAIQRFMNYSEGERNKEKQIKIFNVSIILHFIISIIVGFLLIIAGFFFFNGILNIPENRVFAAKIVYASLVVSTIFTVMTAPYDAVMNAHENMKYYAIIGVVESLLKLGVALVCVFVCFDKLIVYGVLMSVIPLVSLSVMRLYCNSHYEECKISYRKYFDKSLMKEMTVFAGWNLIGVSGSMIGNYGNNIVVNHFFGVVVNAAMGVVTQLQGMLMVLTGNMNKALNPVIVKKEGEGSREESIKWSLAGCRFAYMLLLWLAVPIYIEADFILTLWLKNVPVWTVLFLRLQLIRTLLELLFLSLKTTLAAVGKIKELNVSCLIIFIVPLVLQIGLFMFGFPPYWTYILMIIAVLFQGGVIVWLCKRYCTLTYDKYFKEVFFPMILLTLVLYFVGDFVHAKISNGWYCLISTFVSVWSVFAISLFAIILSSDEKQVIYTILNRIKRH